VTDAPPPAAAIHHPPPRISHVQHVIHVIHLCRERPWVHVVPTPDTYRGAHRNPNTAGEEYAAHVAAAVKACEAAQALEEAEMSLRQGPPDHGEGRGLAAFIVESGMSVGGVIMPPKVLVTKTQKHTHTHDDNNQGCGVRVLCVSSLVPLANR
jgi:4-aminobutyrate aminotransferase-like enzyme